MSPPLRRHTLARAWISALAVMATSLLAGGAARALMISEVMANPVGGFGSDDGLEWVELYNETATPVDLSGFSLGWGGADYTYGSMSLAGAGTLGAGQYIVIGGPAADFAVDFAPDIPDGFIAAAGVGLFVGTDTSLTPIDAVIYSYIFGANVNGLVDETGAVAAVDVNQGAGGQSIERQTNGSWTTTAAPTPGTGVLVPEPQSALMTGLGLALLSLRARSRR